MFKSQEDLLKAAHDTAKEITSVPLPDKTAKLYKRLVKPDSRVSEILAAYYLEMDALSVRQQSGESAMAIRKLREDNNKRKSKL